MGWYDSFNKFLVENLSVGPVVSGPDTNHIYYSDAKGEVKTDDDYTREFENAKQWLLEKRPNDPYIYSIARQRAIEASIDTLKKNLLNDDIEHDGHAIRWKVTFESGKSILVWLMTPNAVQLKRDGQPFYSTDKYDWCHYRVECYPEYWEKVREREQAEKIVQRLQEKLAEVNRKKEIAARSHLESFLGVKFGDDYRKYVTKDAERADIKNGMILVEATMNHFLEFDTYCVIKPFKGNSVIGVWCCVDRDNIEDEEAFVDNIKSILEEKYHRKFDGEISFDDDGNENDENKIEMSFYSDEEKMEDCTHGITIDVDQDSITLWALDGKLLVKAIKDYEANQVKKKKSSRMSALDAL